MKDGFIKVACATVPIEVCDVRHNLDVIKMADYIIDMGPEGGKGGGELLSYGTPEEVAKSPKGYTPKFLREELGL